MGRTGKTPLHWAADFGLTQCVQLLLQHVANTSIEDNDGKTPLHWAAEHSHSQCVQLLLQHGADTSIQDAVGMTPLHRAADTQCVQLLLQHGADTSIQNMRGMTPLHRAAISNHTQCVQLLLQHGADTSIQDKIKKTPLHWAAEYGYTRCVQLLLQHGADTSIQDRENKTPRLLAEEEERLVIVELLRRFEIHDIKVYIQTRVLEYLAEILDPAEYRGFYLNNLNPNCPDIFQFQKVQGVKDWIAKKNYTTIKDIRDGLLTANLLRLSSAVVEYYAEMVTNISNMSPDEFEAHCRTLTTAKYMYTPRSTTRGMKGESVPLDQYHQDTFIAYAEEDEPTIRPVVRELKKLEIQCWFAEEDLIPGKYVNDETVKAISASRFSILFLSKSFIQSRGCNYVMENIVENAKEKEHGVIPVVMNISPEEIPDKLRNWKSLFFYDEELIPKILAAIKGPRNTTKYGQLRHENEVLQGQNEVLRDENHDLRDEVRQLTAKLRLRSQ